MKKLFVLILILALGFYFFWGFINIRPGEQHVAFVPANNECFSEVSDGSRLLYLSR